MAATRILFLPLVAALGGCAVGSSKYACPGMPERPVCASTHDVYEMTGQGATVTGPSDPARHGARSPATVERNDFLPETTGDVIPLRAPAKVMRIWISPWEGDDGDLHVTGLLYTEIEPRRWQIGLPATEQPPDIILLDPGAGSSGVHRQPVPSTGTPGQARGAAPAQPANGEK